MSFLWPGLGQWYEGRPRRALLYATPPLIVAAVVAVQLASNATVLAARLINPNFALTILALVALLGIWRIASVVEAATVQTSLVRLRSRTLGVTALLVALVVTMHGVAGYYAWSFYDAGTRIFVGDNGDGPPGPDPSGPQPTDDYDVPPFATPEPGNDRITVLLTGIDKTTERTHSLTDTLLVVSLDPATGDIAMVSFPRDIAEFPLYSGGTYQGKINSLMSYAASHRDEFPDGPLPTLAKQLGYLLGTPINYYAAIDIDGFTKMIDAVGGVTVNVERRIDDGFYDWLDGSPRGFHLDAGPQRLDTRTALAYVRSRFGVGDNDFTRADRQQQLLLALREELTDPTNIGRVPSVLGVAADTVRTNFPAERIDEMIVLAQQIASKDIERVVLRPPDYAVHPPTDSTGGIYILRIKWQAIRTLSVRLFGEDSDFWSGQVDAEGSPIPLAAP